MKRQTEQNPSLVQISEYYGPQRDQPIIPRSQYVEIKPAESSEEPEKPNQVLCESAGTGIVVEGNHVGKIVQICADPECPIHHAPQQQEREEWDEEYERAAEERRKNLAENLELLDSVLANVPAVLGRADHEMMIAAWMESLDYEDFERMCERHQLPFEETETEEDIRESFRQYVSKLADAEVSRFMMELALLPSGYSSNRLEDTDRLMVAAKLYCRPRKRLAAVAVAKGKQKPTSRVPEKKRTDRKLMQQREGRHKPPRFPRLGRVGDLTSSAG